MFMKKIAVIKLGAKGIPAIGIKTDEPVEEAFEYLSAILIGSMEIVTSVDELRGELEKFGEEKRGEES